MRCRWINHLSRRTSGSVRPQADCWSRLESRNRSDLSDAGFSWTYGQDDVRCSDVAHCHRWIRCPRSCQFVKSPSLRLSRLTKSAPANGSIGKTSDYTTAIVPNGFRGVRIGVPRQFFYNESRTGLASEVYTTTEAVLNRISTLGASVLTTNLPSTEEFVESGNETIVLNFDFKNDLAIYLSELTNSSSATSSTPWGIKTLADAINFNDANAAVEMPAGQCCQGPSLFLFVQELC